MLVLHAGHAIAQAVGNLSQLAADADCPAKNYCLPRHNAFRHLPELLPCGCHLKMQPACCLWGDLHCKLLKALTILLQLLVHKTELCGVC